MKSKIVSILIFIFFAGTYAMAADVQTHYFGYEAEGGEGGLPKTGQTVQYTSGDDGTYEMGWSGTRFTANGDGTITDNATGLMWVANPSAVPTTVPSVMGKMILSKISSSCASKKDNPVNNAVIKKLPNYQRKTRWHQLLLGQLIALHIGHLDVSPPLW